LIYVVRNSAVCASLRAPRPCRATAAEQQSNTRRTFLVVYRGAEMALANAIRAAGSIVRYDVARQRLRHGWEIERALSTPTQRCTNSS
jgi:hypothetical protein